MSHEWTPQTLKEMIEMQLAERDKRWDEVHDAAEKAMLKAEAAAEKLYVSQIEYSTTKERLSVMRDHMDTIETKITALLWVVGVLVSALTIAVITHIFTTR